MKLICSIFLAMVMTFAAPSVYGYMINDLSNDAIGVRTFEVYGIDVYNFTPGVNSGPVTIDLFTNYPQRGLLVGSWDTKPADLFIKESHYGRGYQWAIPLVNHNGFSAGTMYAVESYNVSDDFAPGSGYIYNHNIPVRIATMGNNYGWSSIGGGLVEWISNNPGSPDWTIHIVTAIWEDDPNGKFSLLWGTAICANDVISSIPVPEPVTMLLVGSGLIGVAGFARRFKK